MPIQSQEFVEDATRVFDPSAQTHEIKLDLVAELLRNGEQARLSVLGASMLPTIWPRDMVTISKIEYCDIAPGDIVVVARGGKLLIHRVVKTANGGWVTRGDSASQMDFPISAVDLLGKVISIKRDSREFAPSKTSGLQRISGWLLCHSDHIRNLALTYHARRMRRFTLKVTNN